MRRAVLSTMLALGAVLVVAGCKPIVSVGGGSSNADGDSTGGDSSTSGNGGQAGAGAGGAAGAGAGGATGGGTGSGGCQSGPNDDADQDGFTPAQGDCDDCDPGVNPDAVEVPTLPGATPRDENCNGAIDEGSPPCDGAFNIDDPAPANAAKAIDICKVSAGPNDWGLVSAAWVLSDGSPPPANMAYDLGHGILDGFGPNVSVQHGAQMLALSSGTARRPSDPGYVDFAFAKNYQSGQPAGFPKPAPACPGVLTGDAWDAAALEVTLRVPSNVTGFGFDFDFYTHEFPSFVCSTFNDLFVAMLSPVPAGQMDGNISFDAMGNPVTVNNAFLEVCGCDNGPPCFAGGKTYTCGLGESQLLGTGFGASAGSGHGYAATGWLVSSAPADPGSTITLRFAIHDSGDGVLDSTVLVDNFHWVSQGVPLVQVQTVRAPKN